MKSNSVTYITNLFIFLYVFPELIISILYLDRTDNKFFNNDLSEIEINALLILTIFFIKLFF